jgi:hypothetical protein
MECYTGPWARTDIIKRNAEALFGSWRGREVVLEVNTEKTKCMVVSHHQNACQNKNLLIAKISFENVAKFICLETAVRNQNRIHEEIKSRLNMGECLLPFSSESFVFPSPV